MGGGKRNSRKFVAVQYQIHLCNRHQSSANWLLVLPPSGEKCIEFNETNNVAVECDILFSTGESSTCGSHIGLTVDILLAAPQVGYGTTSIYSSILHCEKRLLCVGTNKGYYTTKYS